VGETLFWCRSAHGVLTFLLASSTGVEKGDVGQYIKRDVDTSVVTQGKQGLEA